jgi:hypothetical protein
MLQKTDPHFGGLPLIGKRVPCDFSAMRGIRAQTVSIRHASLPARSVPPGNALSIRRKMSRDARGKTVIRSIRTDRMHGASRKNNLWKMVNAGRRRRRNRGLKPRQPLMSAGVEPPFTARFERVASDFVLLYLTLVAIFDNRLGLLKKFDVGERRKPCQP